MKLKDLVKDNKVKFLYYRKNELWYEVDKLFDNKVNPGDKLIENDQYFGKPLCTFFSISLNEEGWYKVPPILLGTIVSNEQKNKFRRFGPKFVFPVPIDDTGDGQFLAEDKASMYMRWIRKQLEEVEKENLIKS